MKLFSAKTKEKEVVLKLKTVVQIIGISKKFADEGSSINESSELEAVFDFLQKGMNDRHLFTRQNLWQSTRLGYRKIHKEKANQKERLLSSSSSLGANLISSGLFPRCLHRILFY